MLETREARTPTGWSRSSLRAWAAPVKSTGMNVEISVDQRIRVWKGFLSLLSVAHQHDVCCRLYDGSVFAVDPREKHGQAHIDCGCAKRRLHPLR